MRVMSSRRELRITLLLLLAAAIAISFLVVRLVPSAQDGSTGTGQALIGGPFTLVDHQGEEVTEKSFAGRYMLVYFGYTFCPDICPLGLQTMMAAYDELPADMRAKVAPIFITVDPERDTAAALSDYVTLFHPDLIGLTGTVEQTDAAAKAYRVYHAKAVDAADADEYLVDHSAFFYLMGPDGQYIRHFGHDASAEEMATGIKEAFDS